MRTCVLRVPNMINNIISNAPAALQWKAPPDPVQQETKALCQWLAIR